MFGIISSSKETNIINKFKYTTLSTSTRHYIYSNEINNESIYMHEWINKLFHKYNLKNINELKKIF